MIRIIGLTGPSGSGKTVLCELASELGIKSINADDIYHELLIPPSSCLDELVHEFGECVKDSRGYLDRAALSAIVFDPADTKKDKLKRLNKITHKYVLDEMRRIIGELEKSGETTVIVDAPALYESGFDKECDAIICLLSDPALRLERITLRDGISQSRARERLDAQQCHEFYSSRADFVILNNGSVEHLRTELERVMRGISTP